MEFCFSHHSTILYCLVTATTNTKTLLCSTRYEATKGTYLCVCVRTRARRQCWSSRIPNSAHHSPTVRNQDSNHSRPSLTTLVQQLYRCVCVFVKTVSLCSQSQHGKKPSDVEGFAVGIAPRVRTRDRTGTSQTCSSSVTRNAPRKAENGKRLYK